MTNEREGEQTLWAAWTAGTTARHEAEGWLSSGPWTEFRPCSRLEWWWLIRVPVAFISRHFQEYILGGVYLGFCDLQFLVWSSFTIFSTRWLPVSSNSWGTLYSFHISVNWMLMLIYSKISAANVRQNVRDLLTYSTDEKKRNFTETIELQIGLKNYDPQRCLTSRVKAQINAIL